MGLPFVAVFIGFQKEFEFGLLFLYQQHILGATKSEDPLPYPHPLLAAGPLKKYIFFAASPIRKQGLLPHPSHKFLQRLMLIIYKNTEICRI